MRVLPGISLRAIGQQDRASQVGHISVAVSRADDHLDPVALALSKPLGRWDITVVQDLLSLAS